MRATALSAAVVAAMLPRLAAAAECEWRPVDARPELRIEDRLVIFESFYDTEWARCAREAGGTVEVQFFDAASRSTPLRTEKVRLSVSDRDATGRVEAKLFPNAYCKGEPPRGRVRKTLAGYGRKEHVAYPVKIFAKVNATGAMLPLTFKANPVAADCPLCSKSRPRGTVRLTQGRRSRLEISADAEWFACARERATLELRFFVGDSRDEVKNAIRPVFVLSGLERSFATSGKSAKLDRRFDQAKLCAGRKRYLAYETWGRGELKRLSGGGRYIEKLICR